MYTNFYLVIGNPTKFITLSPSQNDFLTCKDGRTTTGEFFFLFFPSLFFFHTLLQLSTSVILGVQVFSLLFFYCMNCLHHTTMLFSLLHPPSAIHPIHIGCPSVYNIEPNMTKNLSLLDKTFITLSQIQKNVYNIEPNTTKCL